MNRKVFALLLVTVLTGAYAKAQGPAGEEPEGKKGFDKSKLFFGGTFGVSFSSYYTLVNVSPQIGYRFNDYLAAGAGVNFIYSSTKDFYSNGADYSRQTLGVAGLNIFGRVYPIQQLFFQLQPELNYTWGNIKYYTSPATKYNLDSKIVPSLLGGAGGAIPTGGRGAFIIMVQYDLLQQERSPYGNRA
ncbi:MAG: hypothetical protein JST39_06800, partial [Bacteroidetes bacterium]|nr:hypothetical protein [Bacteroidota bacterium]